MKSTGGVNGIVVRRCMSPEQGKCTSLNARCLLETRVDKNHYVSFAPSITGVCPFSDGLMVTWKTISFYVEEN